MWSRDSELYESLKRRKNFFFRKKKNSISLYFSLYQNTKQHALDTSNGWQNHTFLRKDYRKSLYLLPQFWKHMAIGMNELAGRKYIAGIKGSIIVGKRWDAREEVVVPMVQGTIHPFQAVSNKKSGFSLYRRGQHRSRRTYFPWRSLCRHLSISPITPALPSISMARFFHQAGMWFNGVTKILLFRSPRPRGHESGSVGSRSTSSVTTIEPLFASCLYCFTMLRFIGE